MASVTLHKLLWGVSKSRKVDDWRIRCYEVPAVGLPTRVAAALLLAARDKQRPSDWSINKGPLVWTLENCKEVIGAGRRLQLGYSDPGADEDRRKKTPVVTRSTGWDVPPHPAYYIPLVNGLKPPTPRLRSPSRLRALAASYVLYCDVLLFLTALDGGERILDSLHRSGLSGVPFQDRWAWRSRIHLSEETWKTVDRVIQWAIFPTVPMAVNTLSEFAGVLSRSFSFQDFVAERIDVLLQEGHYLEVVRSAGPFRGSPKLRDDLELDDEKLSGSLNVRIAQVSRWYSQVTHSFPAVAAHEAHAVMQQVAGAFQNRASDNQPALVLLPEASIPQNEVATLRQLVSKTGVAALAGLFWRELQAVYPGRVRLPKTRQRWIVNEAELIVPLGHDTPGPPTVRWFRVRKPVPAHIEEGLARALTKQSKIKFHLLKGRRWYRFVHRRWGDFSIAICADLIDAEPWRVFRGEMLHLFTVAFNKDVELFDALTWVRAYESYVNVLAVNHGLYGGSFVWTPKGSHARELARLRGSGLLLLADVEIPVKGLLDEQIKGVKTAVDAAKREWQGRKQKMQKPRTFKAPPPGYRRRR